jgi:PEGA domain
MRYAAIAAILVGLVATSVAQTPDVKRELAAGIDAFRLGKYDEARAHLEAARSLDRKLGDPHRYLAAVAQAESKWDDCIASAREALLVEPASKDAADTRKLHAACRASGGRPAFVGELGEGAALAVTANIRAATVKVRGLVFGGTPIAPRMVTPGRLAIDIEKGGYLTVHLDIDVLPGIVTDVDVKLEAGEEPTSVPLARKVGSISLPADLRVDSLVIDGSPAKRSSKIELSPGVHVIELRVAGKDPWRRQVAITADNTTAIAPELVDSGPREARRLLGIGLAGGGIALAALGVGAFYKSRGASDEARSILAAEIARPIGDTTPPLRTRADFEDARSRANRWATISNLAYGAGLIAGGAGLYFILKGRAPADDDVPAFAIAPVVGGAVIARSASW